MKRTHKSSSPTGPASACHVAGITLPIYREVSDVQSSSCIWGPVIVFPRTAHAPYREGRKREIGNITMQIQSRNIGSEIVKGRRTWCDAEGIEATGGKRDGD